MSQTYLSILYISILLGMYKFPQKTWTSMGIIV
nr:MAG TPA: hypothetical protein [Bacteriophage sp.]